MYQLSKYLMVLLAAAVITSCKEDESPAENPFFNMDAGISLSFKASGGEQSLNVITNQTFTAASSAEWCKPEIVGRGQNNLKIAVAANEEPAERTASITVAADGYPSYTIAVTQAFVAPKPPVTDGVDMRVVDLEPDLYYAFHDETNYAAPFIGSAPLDFSTGNVTATSAPEGRKAVTIVKDNHVKVMTPMAGGVKTYTMLYDVRVPALNLWYSLLQTHENNGDDGDLFIDKAGKVGVSQYTDPIITPNEWVRIVMVVDVANGASVCKYYINGQFAFANGSSSIPGRMGLGNHFWLFTDEDGEENNLDCAGFVLWAGTMLTDEQIASLGGVAGIPSAVDKRITAAAPDLYYAFHDEANYAAPFTGTTPLEFSLPASVVAASNAPEGRKAVTFAKDNHTKVITPAGGARSFTMLYDVRVPLLGDWHALLQTHVDNSDDADFYINRTGSLGLSSYSPVIIESGNWYRIVIVIDADATLCKYYVNGEFLFDNSSRTGNKTLGPHFWIFTDRSEESDTDCAAFAVWANKVLSEEEIAALGAAE